MVATLKATNKGTVKVTLPKSLERFARLEAARISGQLSRDLSLSQYISILIAVQREHKGK
jgi:hypothetical protein